MNYKVAALSEQVHRFYSNTPNQFLPHHRMMIRKTNDIKTSKTCILLWLSKWHNCFIVADLIAIPDFVSGAMEHWGLITFRETNVLYDPDEASSANQQRVATVVAHEVAHMVNWYKIIYAC